MPIKESIIELEIKKRFFKAVRFIVADVDKYGIKNITAFSTELDWPTQSMARAKNNDNFYVPVKCLAYIILNYGVDADWLMTGRGELKFHELKKPKTKSTNKST